jgi:ABC-type dipeptide/oligopeptide/nickel transport system permease component
MYFVWIKVIKKILNKYDINITSLKLTLILFFLLLILVWVFWAFCWWAIMISEFINWVSNIEQISFYEISIPSFVIGILLIIFWYLWINKKEKVLRLIKKIWKKKQ